MPKVTFGLNTIKFDLSCANLFPDSQYVTISIDESNLRLIIEPATHYDADGLKFANFKNGKNVPRTCTVKYFCLMLFDFMKWNSNAKYCISAIYQEFGDKKVLVLNLDEARQVVSKAEKRKIANTLPDWKERFGYRMSDHSGKTQVKC